MLTDIEAVLHVIYNAAKKYTTQQELSDALDILKQAEEKIVNPAIDMSKLLAPSTNLNRKGRKSNKRGIKSGTERLEILKELHDKKQKEVMKKKEKEAKKEEEINSQKRLLEIEERHVALELKKRKITLIHRDSDGTFPQLNTKTTSSKNTETSNMESDSSIDRRIIIYSNPKKDVVFKYVGISPKSVLSKIHCVSGDGNCGFRAVSLSIYNDQESWLKVKQDMLRTYEKYQDSLYKPVATTQNMIDFEHTKMLNKLKSTVSPCTDPILWFSTFTCPQVVSDTYNRPVIVFTYREYYVEKERKMKEYKEAMSFFPLVEMNIMENTNNPVLLLLVHSHFYLVEIKRTLKRYEKIPLNPDHQRVRKMYPEQCNSVDFSIMW